MWATDISILKPISCLTENTFPPYFPLNLTGDIMRKGYIWIIGIWTPLGGQKQPDRSEMKSRVTLNGHVWNYPLQSAHAFVLQAQLCSYTRRKSKNITLYESVFLSLAIGPRWSINKILNFVIAPLNMSNQNRHLVLPNIWTRHSTFLTHPFMGPTKVTSHGAFIMELPCLEATFGYIYKQPIGWISVA